MNWFARIVMGLLGLVFLAVLLGALGLYTVFATLRWLLTGRKPQVVLVWQQFSALRKGARWGARPGFESGFEPPRQDDIVDVEVREVVEDPPRLPPRQQG
ncbi:hypothetical protein B9Z45_11170 [Limnohabitans sp. 2KL-17]|uniref:hypothetical protein n=1 Tax=Limnohabitans sp. 2KL-17 TaxID=1100704 RepID=UPI000D38AC27|nr:hypothetical protein [Limnohabitans sp. 2KL-17]PUE54759.1 hypothetical protein B9Z45_11170 [Limnohabitans sp. 2KL-17]